MNMPPFDLLIVGGGINGAGIARDAAGRGLRVGLCEANDFAGATSSASTKLIHGGLRYLEYYEFRLVAEALAERENLLAIAPHIAWPLRFVMPHVRELRPRWMIRTGLWLYDRLGGRNSLPKSASVKLSGTRWGAGLSPQLHDGFVYSDAWVDDARLVILNLRSAQQHGAEIFARTRLLDARRSDGLWHCTVADASGATRILTSRTLVNAAGPWVGQVEQLAHSSRNRQGSAVRLVRGSHIVVPRLYDGEHAYILQNDDRRIVFMIPYEGEFTLIGTTDVAQENMDHGVQVAPHEEAYLLRAVNRYLARPVDAGQIAWRYAGVRPLFDDESDNPSAITRDYTLALDEGSGLPLLSIYGGKITTYRRLAEASLSKLAQWIPGAADPWTATEPLPGGEFPPTERAVQLRRLQQRYPGLPAQWLATLFARHGLLAHAILDDARSFSDLGRDFGGGLSEREVTHLVKHEWAASADDVLWRRTKCGLHMQPAERAAFADWFDHAHAGRAMTTTESGET
ncbi:glycerol-3-phosphate dehydrogenase [Lacisediminimonas profundi]|uniref:glycerol-3-phosphate dehydrogenase n=1 Tax=Lacisediminimonas profundi TaxID=2603856 RepID=UPI00124B31BC|nr:glycerol-3-phosphate dehydrogenase [Lacisediminimonas profundi]